MEPLKTPNEERLEKELEIYHEKVLRQEQEISELKTQHESRIKAVKEEYHKWRDFREAAWGKTKKIFTGLIILGAIVFVVYLIYWAASGPSVTHITHNESKVYLKVVDPPVHNVSSGLISDSNGNIWTMSNYSNAQYNELIRSNKGDTIALNKRIKIIHYDDGSYETETECVTLLPEALKGTEFFLNN